MNILGLHFGHDGSAALVREGKLVVAISNERISRVKKAFGVTEEMINYCLNESGLTIEQVDIVSCAEYFKKWAPEGASVSYSNGNSPEELNQRYIGNDISENLFITILGKRLPLVSIPHHLAHASASFFTSPFDESDCFSLDACGEPIWNSSYLNGKDSSITAVSCPLIMCGPLYNTITHQLLIGNPLFKSGSTMGLASYGAITEDFKKLENKTLLLSLLRESEPFSKQNNFRKLAEILTSKRSDETISEKEKYNKASMNIAANTQYLFEESILNFLNNNLDKKTECNNLCLSGGSFLNCNVNSRILNETRYKNVHIFPASGDDGISVGSALYVAHHIFKYPRIKYETKDICYLGKNYFSKPVDTLRIAKAISNGKIVGYMSGRSEFGPRALGHRSILADPRSYHNRELINFCIKKREWFRPFAPSVLAEKSSDWFIHPCESPYMLFSAQVKHPELVPAITHVDNTARMQTVKRDTNPEFYDIISNFGDITNIPMVLNTSLNGDGEPVLETPEEGMEFFKSKEIDMMVINGDIFEK